MHPPSPAPNEGATATPSASLMRLKSILIPAAAFAIAALVSWQSARVLVRMVESRSVVAVETALANGGHDWATVIGDGLQIVIEGQAPSEAMRFRAMSAAGTVVDASRVIDNMRVRDPDGVVAPDFAVEILRNDSGVSLVGLIPAATDREALAARIAAAAGGQNVADLLQTADYPVPHGWDSALDYALLALARLPRSKISVEAGAVELTAIAASREERQRLEADLARAAPRDLVIEMTINAPRPVITPFTLRFTIDDRGARFDACAADTEEARDAILAAGLAAGAPPAQSCTLALGVPSGTWGRATARAIAALAELGGGTLTFSDADVTLVAAEGTDPALFDRVVGELGNALPDIYSLDATLPDPMLATEQGPPEFTATLDDSGTVTLRGRVADDLTNQTAETFAQANFGAGNVTMGTRLSPEGLPQGWTIRVLAGIEALSHLGEGTVRVLPETLRISGRSGEADAEDAISRMLIERLGQSADFDLAVTYDESLDPIAALPTPEECVAQITTVTADHKITFDPGSATISADGVVVLDSVAEILRRCAELRLRIAGYTDSQGRDETNLALSQARAEAVLQALRARRVPVSAFEAIGYGEADPIADNETDAGREANRRIEFSLIQDTPAAPVDPVEIWPDAPGPLAPGTGSGGPERPAIRLEPRPDGLAAETAAGEDSEG